jgi:hypothetical protein
MCRWYDPHMLTIHRAEAVRKLPFSFKFLCDGKPIVFTIRELKKKKGGGGGGN